MEFPEANRILRSVKVIFASEDIVVPPKLETDGIMILLNKTNAESYLEKFGNTPSGKAKAYPLFIRSLEAAAKKGDINNAVSLAALHKFVCEKVDKNAGKFRTTEKSMGENAYADSKLINGSLKSLFEKMRELKSSPEISRADFAVYITHYMWELTILCPFAEYSQLVVKLFLMRFCTARGFSLNYYKTSPEVLKEAENQAFLTDNVKPLYSAVLPCISYDWHVPDERAKSRREISVKKREMSHTPDKPEVKDKKNNAAHEEIKPAKPASHEVPVDYAMSEHESSSLTMVSTPDDVVKRAIKIQQKIAKLNDQLKKLMEPYSADKRRNKK